MKFVLMGLILVFAPGTLTAQVKINPDDLIGTWQLMTRRNTRTGVVDTVANRRVAWEGFTRNTYHLFEMDLNPTGATREQLIALPSPQERQHRHLDAVHYMARGG